MFSVASDPCPFRTFSSLGNRKKSNGARSGEYGGCCNRAVPCLAKNCCTNVKYMRAHCRGAGSSRHHAIFPVVFGELIHANVARPPRRILCKLFAPRDRTRGVRYPQNLKTPVIWLLFCFAPGTPTLVAETWDPSTVTIAVLSPGRNRRPRTRHLSHCSYETARVHMNAQTNHGRLSDVAHVGHLLVNATQTSHTHKFHVQIVG